jgi:serpin B
MSNTVLVVLGSFLLAALSSLTNTAFAGAVYAPLVAGNNDFALSMYAQLAANNTGNIFFSPYSISTCLGMAYDGAAGETAQQMAQALDFSTNQADVGAEFGALQDELNSQQGQGGISLNIANGLWAQQNFPFLPAFIGNAVTNFDANVQQVNFGAASPSVTDEINGWVGDQTHGMITNLFAPGALNGTTVMALVNAIYFKGAWGMPFDTNATYPDFFYVSPSQTVTVPMMTELNTGAGLYQDSLLQAAELPYGNSNLVMIILLPRATNGLAGMEAALTPQELGLVFNNLRPCFWGLDVFLPKFSLTMAANLIPPLENLGMLDAFVPGVADFSNMDGGRDLSIQVIVHKAVVEVDEAGTVAAGSTGIGIISAVLPPPPPVFFANHPFVFLICDMQSGSILFMGRVADPTVSGASTPPPPPPHPQIQTGDGHFGIQNSQFGFNVTGTNSSLIVEACTNMTAGPWSPVGTITLTNGAGYFSEPIDPSAPNRFYRVRSR